MIGRSLLTLPKAAEWLRVSARSVRRLVEAGACPVSALAGWYELTRQT